MIIKDSVVSYRIFSTNSHKKATGCNTQWLFLSHTLFTKHLTQQIHKLTSVSGIFQDFQN